MRTLISFPDAPRVTFIPGNLYHDKLNGQTYLACNGDSKRFLVNVESGMLRRSFDMDPFDGTPENFIDVTKQLVLSDRPV